MCVCVCALVFVHVSLRVHQQLHINTHSPMHTHKRRVHTCCTLIGSIACACVCKGLCVHLLKCMCVCVCLCVCVCVCGICVYRLSSPCTCFLGQIKGRTLCSNLLKSDLPFFFQLKHISDVLIHFVVHLIFQTKLTLKSNSIVVFFEKNKKKNTTYSPTKLACGFK